jgi:hypothetical protein
MLDEAAQDAFNRWWCEQWQTQQLQLVNSPTDAQQKWLDKVLELRLADETMSTAELSLAFN